MSTIEYIILFNVISSLLGLIGGAALLIKKKFAYKFSHFFAAFAAGTLLGTAFLDLFHEALEGEGVHPESIFIWALVGFLAFFVFERFIHWFHSENENVKVGSPTVALIVFGDALHNFIDGIVIGTTFMVSVPLGIVTSLAVGAHEIPQEIGDFGVLLKKGLRRKNIILLNLLSAATAIFGGIIAFMLGEAIEGILPILLSIAAGFFIYIAASDLIPDIHKENRNTFALAETSLLILGVVVVYFAILLLE